MIKGIAKINGIEYVNIKNFDNTIYDLRKEVINFAKEIENQLKANDHKGGWKNCNSFYLLNRLKEETKELEEEMKKSIKLHSKEITLNKKIIIREATDIANFAMMISDIFFDS